MRVGIVGAGMAGLACAARLKSSGIETVLFDKGKRPGGRLSTLSLDSQAWDFGAQYFKAGEGSFAAQVALWRQAGLVADWDGGPDGALVGVPAMASLIEAQSGDHDVRFGSLVQRIESDGLSWFLSGPGLREGPFAALVIAIPSEQAAPLLSLHDLHMAREAAAARSQPCWTVMAGFPQPVPVGLDYLADIGAIAWAARDNSKPGRQSGECWVIQAGPEWTQRHLEADRDDVASQLLAIFAAEAAAALPNPSFLKAHRWRFALSYGQRGQTLWNPKLRLGACGDWCQSPPIEGAWRSGTELAERIAATCALGEKRPQAAGAALG
ncbi:MAG: NAD(P)/FAD-dependent oxidoreductase [Novosphingobium sp.]